MALLTLTKQIEASNSSGSRVITGSFLPGVVGYVFSTTGLLMFAVFYATSNQTIYVTKNEDINTAFEIELTANVKHAHMVALPFEPGTIFGIYNPPAEIFFEYYIQELP